MKKSVVLTYAEKCKNILVSNWQGQLNTIKADAKGSKEDIHSSKIKYFFKRGKPYVWVPKNDNHNLNTIIDERASLAVSSPSPGALAGLLRSLKKLPTRVALTGDLTPLNEERIRSISESVRETVLSEQLAISQASYSVSGILSSPNGKSRHRSESLQEVLDATPYSGKLIDGINQSQSRRRALMLFCFVYMKVNARDALILGVDRRGFDVLGRVESLTTKDGLPEYQWREFRFTFQEEAKDVETFCRLLVEMEEEALKTVQDYSGLG
ncbi:hypothetical protein ACHQM5_009798 [Ranunculus cassubicifolius]